MRKKMRKSVALAVAVLIGLSLGGPLVPGAEKAHAQAPVEFVGISATMEDVGYNPQAPQDGFPFMAVYNIGNHFVAAGACIAAPLSGHEPGDGGLYLLDLQGRVVDSRNVCNEDEGGRIGGEQGLDPGIHVHPAGGNRFVVSGADTHPPRLYEIQANKMVLVSRAYDLKFSYLNEDGNVRSLSQNAGAHGAVAGGYYFELMAKGSGGGQPGMAVFRLPSFEVVGFVENVDGSDVPPRPIVGVGDLLVIRKITSERIGGRNRGVNYAEVFRVNADGSITFVETLGRFWALAASRDASNGNRFALVTTDPTLRYEGTVSVPDHRLKTYSLSAAGLSLESDVVKNDMRGAAGPVTRFGLNGQVLVYGGSGDIGLRVENGNNLSGIKGEEGGFLGGRIYSTAISSGGQVVASLGIGRSLALFSSVSGTTLPANPFPSGDPNQPVPIIPGQLLEIGFPGTSPAPSILVRFATINSVTQGNMNISIYNQTYSVNTQNAQLLRQNRSQATLSEFVPGGFVNVFGTLDTVTGTNINASIVRNPLPTSANAAFPTSNVTAPTTVAPTNLNTATQNTLGNLEQILLDLQQQFAR